MSKLRFYNARRTRPERHAGRTIAGVRTRIALRVLALAAAIAAIWHNDALGLTIRRSLTAYDH